MTAQPRFEVWEKPLARPAPETRRPDPNVTGLAAWP